MDERQLQALAEIKTMRRKRIETELATLSRQAEEARQQAETLRQALAVKTVEANAYAVNKMSELKAGDNFASGLLGIARSISRKRKETVRAKARHAQSARMSSEIDRRRAAKSKELLSATHDEDVMADLARDAARAAEERADVAAEEELSHLHRRPRR